MTGAPSPQPLERDIQGAIVRTLKMLGASIYSTSQVRPSMVSEGLPDLLVFSPRAGFTFAEIKRPGGRMSDAQVQFRQECIACGVGHHIWTSVEEAVRWLEAS